MANSKFSNLTTISVANGNDIIPLSTNRNSVLASETILYKNFFGNVTVNTNFNSNVVIGQLFNVKFGNSSVNSFINSISFSYKDISSQTIISSSGLNVNNQSVINTSGIFSGSNSYINNLGFHYANSTTSLHANCLSIIISNTSNYSANININGLIVGKSSVNTIGLFVGSNVSVNVSSFYVGNDSVYSSVNSSSINVGSILNISNTTISVGNSSSNTKANSSVLKIGNSTVNCSVNSTTLVIANSTANVIFVVPNTSQISSINKFFHANSNWVSPEEHMILDVSRDESNTITTGTGKYILFSPFNLQLTRNPLVMLSTNSTSGIVTVDVKNNSGVSIFSTLLTIDANESTSHTSAIPAVMSSDTFNISEKMSIDIIGAGTGAKGLKLVLFYKRT